MTTGHFTQKIFKMWSNTAATGLYGFIRSEQEVNAFQIWSNNPNICWLIRSKY